MVLIISIGAQLEHENYKYKAKHLPHDPLYKQQRLAIQITFQNKDVLQYVPESTGHSYAPLCQTRSFHAPPIHIYFRFQPVSHADRLPYVRPTNHS